MNKMKKFYSACLVIIATSAINLSTTFYFIKRSTKKESKNLSHQITVDQILKHPKSKNNLKETQMQKLEKQSKVKVAVIKDTAYWVNENVLYSVKLDEDGRIDIDRAKPVDVFSLSDKDLNHITKVVDSINS
jgi:Na+-translocating ferredoxin:NAD+ oxidoreductase RnfG subunit